MGQISVKIPGQFSVEINMNGQIETMNSAQPTAEAVAILEGRILFVGSSEDAQNHIGSETDVIDLDGKYVTPGFIDVHNHVIASNFLNLGVDLGPATSMDELVALIREYADANPDAEIIQGFNYIPAKIGGNPSAAILDQAVSDRPVLITGNSNHDGVLNTFALERIGVNRDTAIDKQPGPIYWERDSEGDLTGFAIETQYMEPLVQLGLWDPKTMVEPISDYMQGVLIAEGVTTVQVPGLITPNFSISSQGVRDDFEEIMPILQKRVDEGKAGVRLNVMPFIKLPDGDPKEYLEFVLRMRDLYDSDMLRVDSIKLHADGLWPDRATAMIEPYPLREGETIPHMAPIGIDASRVVATHILSAPHDISVVTHADGTLLTSLLADTIVNAKKLYPDSKSRHRIDHASFLNPDTVAKIIEYDIPLNATPIFYNENEAGPGGRGLYDTFMRKVVEQAFGLYTDLAYKGVRVSLGGDSPGTVITQAYPIWLFQQAMTLKQPDADENAQPFPPYRARFTIVKALESVTTVAASQLGMDDVIGSVEVGKYADLAIMDRNLHEVPADELVEMVIVVGTVLNGEFTHRDGM